MGAGAVKLTWRDMLNNELDAQRFRQALRCFATGVTIITTVTPEGEPIGLTANSFNSVSLTPPLVLWSLNKRSRNLPAFENAGHYAINILHADQMSLAGRFASPVENRFEGVDWYFGKNGMPLLAGSVAWFECASNMRHEGGDHLIFIGEVLDTGHSEGTPLLYASGNYSVPHSHPDLARA